MAAPSLTTARPHGRSRALGWSRFIGRAFELFALRRQRLALQRLDDAMLKDIGVSRQAAQAESTRSFWDLPTALR